MFTKTARLIFETISGLNQMTHALNESLSQNQSFYRGIWKNME